MRRIAARRIVPDNELLVRRTLDDGARPILQGLADGLNNWTNERCEQAHDEDGNLLTDSFNELLKTGNLGNSSGNGADNVVSEFENWVNY